MSKSKKRDSDNLPPAVRKMQQEVDEAEAAAKAEASTAVAEPPSPPANEPAQEEPTLQVVVEEPKPMKPAEPAATPAPAAGNEDPNSATWEEKYRVLEGKYRREVEQEVLVLRGQLSAANDNISRLNAQIMHLKERQENAPTVTPIEDIPEDVVSQEERDELGPEMLSIMDKLTRHRAGEMIEPMHEQAANQTLDRYVQRLTDMVPNWRSINTDPDFIKWAQTHTDGLGTPYLDLLRVANDRLDAGNAARFFTLYLESKTNAPPKPSEQLKEEAVPPTSTTSGRGAAPKEVVMIAGSDVERFLDDCTKGRYRRRPAERERIEAEIALAEKEDRIDYSK